MTRPAAHPGTEWTPADALQMGDKVFIGLLDDGTEVWAFVSAQPAVKAKTVWLRLASFTLGIQNIRPRHSDEYQVTR